MNTNINQANNEYIAPLIEGQYKPMLHQQATANFIVNNPRCFVLSEPRTGKTGAILSACHYLLYTRDIKRVIIFTTLSTVKSVWSSNITSMLSEYSCYTHNNKKKPFIPVDKEIYVFNHHCVKTDEFIDKSSDIVLSDSIVIIDEATAFKTPSSTMHKMMKQVSKLVDRMILVTGTIFADNSLVCYGLIKLLYPYKKLNKYSWEEKYMHVKRRHGRIVHCEDVENWKDLIEKNHELVPYIFYPATIIDNNYKVHHILQYSKCSVEQAELIKQLFNNNMLEYGDIVVSVKQASQLINKVKLISAGAIYANDYEANKNNVIYLDVAHKLKLVYNLINKHRKIIIFSSFIAINKLLFSKISTYVDKKNGGTNSQKVGLIIGDVSSAERDTIIHDFTHGEIDILVANPTTIAHGVDLSVANAMIYYTNANGLELYNQSIQRVQGLKQKEKDIYIYYIYSTALEKSRHIGYINGIEEKDVFISNLRNEVSRVSNEMDEVLSGNKAIQ